MAIPEIPRVPTGTTGGLFGSMRQMVIDTPQLYEIFGDRVHPGRQPPGTPLPYIVLSIVSSRSEYSAANDLQGNVTYLNIWYQTIQVAVYAAGFESARVWSKLMHDKTDRHEFASDCFLVIPYVTNMLVVLDPHRAEDGQEVWNFSRRYEVKIPEFMLEEILIED